MLEGTDILVDLRRGGLYLTLHCHHQNDFCIKMGSDDRRFYVLLTVRCKVTRQCPQIRSSFRRESRAETESNRGPSAYQPNAFPLGHHIFMHMACHVGRLSFELQSGAEILSDITSWLTGREIPIFSLPSESESCIRFVR